MSNLAWLFVAVMVVWIAIGAYLVSLSFRQRKLEARMAEIASSEDSA
ncbi:MAG: CcmD family protein [Actinomycetota bacterium]|nr:CcmD family protein [Actinomycetota bacterium]